MFRKWIPNMFEIIIFTAHCQFFINKKFLVNARTWGNFSENRKMLTFVDGENKLSKMQQKISRKLQGR